MACASVAGLFIPGFIYPVEELRNSFVANDVVNFLIGLPILLGSLWFARRGRLVGLLLWPGALMYILYNYIAYILGLPPSTFTIVFIALVLLSAYIIIDLLRSIDAGAVQELLSGQVPVRLTGWVLLVFGILFIFRAVSVLIQGSSAAEFGTLIADIVLAVVMAAGGVLLLRRLPLGYISGLGLLFGASMLFVGLIAYLLLQPVLTGVPFSPVDILVVFVMGLVCFIPFILFLRGTLSVRTSS
jgi:hypothetical protein